MIIFEGNTNFSHDYLEHTFSQLTFHFNGAISSFGKFFYFAVNLTQKIN